MVPFRLVFRLLALALLASQTAYIAAQDFPARPIRLVIPQAVGGATDLIARIVTERVSPRLKQPVIIDNKPGAGGNIATVFVARAPADGYTLFVGNHPGMTTAPVMSKAPGFDPAKDFAPVLLLAKQTMLLTVHPSVPVNTVQEFVAYAKARPGALSYATPGIATPHHLAMELFKQTTGIDLVHVPYKGGAPAMADLVGGQVQVMFASFVIAGPQIRAGKLRAIGSSGNARNTQAPEYPTVAEQGYPGFGLEAWFGIFAPAGTPAAVVDRLNQEYNTALAQPELQQQMLRTGFDPVPPNSPAEFTRIHSGDIEKWSKVIRDAKIQAE